MWRCCLNPKVVAGVVGVGAVVWLIAPAAGGAAALLLIGLICPLSMGVMVWRMRRGPACDVSPVQNSGGDVDAQLRGLREELAIVKAQRRLARRDDGALG